MAIRFLHLADLDLGVQPASLGPISKSRSEEILESFRRAVAFALDPKNRIDALLIAGNLFDRHRPPAPVWAFARGLFGRLAAAQMPVILIPGCRDSAAYRDAIYRTEKLPGANLLLERAPESPLERPIAGQQVFFYAATARRDPRHPLFEGFQRSEKEGLHIGLLNGAVPDLPEWNLRPRNLIIEPEVLSQSGLDYVALGGYHGFTPLELAGTRAAYAGSLEGVGFLPGDLGQKSLLVVDVSPGAVSFEQHPISKRVHEDWKLDLCGEQIRDNDALVAALMARSGEEVVARFTLTGSMEFLADLEEVASALGSRFHYLELVDRSDLLGSSLLGRIQGENTIRGHFVRRMVARIEALLERLRRAPENQDLKRKLRVDRLALKLGLEEFLEEEPVARIFGEKTAGGGEAGAAAQSEANGKRHQKEPEPALPLSENAAAGRAKVLLRRERQAQGLSGEESA